MLVSGMTVHNLEILRDRIAPAFGRPETLSLALRYAARMIAAPDRRGASGGTDRNEARAFQRLFTTAEWDEAKVRELLQVYALEHLNHPDAIFVPVEQTMPSSESGVGVVERKSRHKSQASPHVKTLLLAYSSPLGAVVLDGELLLGENWIRQSAQAKKRASRVGIPEFRQARFQSHELLTKMVARTRFNGFVSVPLSTSTPHKKTRNDDVLGPRRTGTWYGMRGISNWIAVHKDATHPNLEWVLNERGQIVEAVRRSATRPEDFLSFTASSTPPGSTDVPMSPQRLARLGQLVLLGRDAIDEATKKYGLASYSARVWRAWYRHLTLVQLAQTHCVVVEAARTRTTPWLVLGPLVKSPQAFQKSEFEKQPNKKTVRDPSRKRGGKKVR
jgi:hypothetical protein